MTPHDLGIWGVAPDVDRGALRRDGQQSGGHTPLEYRSPPSLEGVISPSGLSPDRVRSGRAGRGCGRGVDPEQYDMAARPGARFPPRHFRPGTGEQLVVGKVAVLAAAKVPSAALHAGINVGINRGSSWKSPSRSGETPVQGRCQGVRWCPDSQAPDTHIVRPRVAAGQPSHCTRTTWTSRWSSRIRYTMWPVPPGPNTHRRTAPSGLPSCCGWPFHGACSSTPSTSV